MICYVDENEEYPYEKLWLDLENLFTRFLGRRIRLRHVVN